MSKLNRVVAINTADGEYVMEYQVESERGFHAMGATYFSSYMRLPLDPAHFSDVSGQPLGERLTDFEVPDGSWVWAWSRWYVDMSPDVDDQGWCYSWHYKSTKWSGRHRFMRSFVRQRLWKRPRVKRYVIERTRMQSYKRESNHRHHHEGTNSASLQGDLMQNPSSGEREILLLRGDGGAGDLSNEKVLPGNNVAAKITNRLRGSLNAHNPTGPSETANIGKLDTPLDVKTSGQHVVRSDSESLMDYSGDLSSSDFSSDYSGSNSKSRHALQSARSRRYEAAAMLDRLGQLRNDRERMDFIYNYIVDHPEHTTALAAARDGIMATLRFPVSRKTLIAKLSQSGIPAAEEFALLPNSSWADHVLLHGEPAKDDEQEDIE